MSHELAREGQAILDHSKRILGDAGLAGELIAGHLERQGARMANPFDTVVGMMAAIGHLLDEEGCIVEEIFLEAEDADLATRRRTVDDTNDQAAVVVLAHLSKYLEALGHDPVEAMENAADAVLEDLAVETAP